MTMTALKLRFHSLGDHNLWIGFISCVIAAALLLDLLAWPFDGPKPTQTHVLLAHFGLAAAGFFIMIRQNQWLRKTTMEDAAGFTFFAVRTFAAAFAGMTQIGIVWWAWENGFQGREWALWLLVPGITGSVGWLWMVGAPHKESENAEGTKRDIKTDGAGIARADISFVRSFSFSRIANLGLIYGSWMAALFAVFALFIVYREAMAEAFFHDHFVGWQELFQWMGRALSGVWPLLAVIGGFLALAIIGENVVRRFSSNPTLSASQQGVAELTDEDAALINAIVQQLEGQLSVNVPKWKKVVTGLATLFVCMIFVTALVILAAWPIFVALWAGGGIGHQFFEGSRTVNLDSALYLDGFGAFEVCMVGASAAAFYYFFCLACRLKPSWWVWSWKVTDKDTRQLQLSRSIAEAVRTGSVKNSDDFSLEQALELLYRRYERGSLIVVGAFVLLSVLAWPIDRIHYAVLSRDVIVSGHYYLPGSVQAFEINEVEAVERHCRQGNESKEIQFDLKLPNGSTVGLLSSWREADGDQKSMLINLAETILASEPSLSGRIDRENCNALLIDRYNDDFSSILPLFQ